MACSMDGGAGLGMAHKERVNCTIECKNPSNYDPWVIYPECISLKRVDDIHFVCPKPPIRRAMRLFHIVFHLNRLHSASLSSCLRRCITLELLSASSLGLHESVAFSLSHRQVRQPEKPRPIPIQIRNQQRTRKSEVTSTNNLSQSLSTLPFISSSTRRSSHPSLSSSPQD